MMKSLKQRNSRPQKNSDEHILPLINVVFLLLIFFMIAGRLTTSDPFKIDPSSSLSSTQEESEIAVIHMGTQGELAFQNEPMDQGTLKDKVRGYLMDHPDHILRLKVDGTYAAGAVLKLMTDLREVGVEKLSLVTQLEAP